MSSTTTDETSAFLDGQGIPVALADIEDELARLWGSADDGSDQADRPAVTRVSLANLVVGCLDAEPVHFTRALDTVVARHPCRVIELRTGTKSPGVSATVSARCTLPAPGVSQVCSEHIVLSAPEADVALLPGAVLPLLESDLPLILWWIGDPARHATVYDALAGEATRLLPDLPEGETDSSVLHATLEPARCKNEFSRDLAWFGISRWRELVAAIFDPPCTPEALVRIDTVEVVASASSNTRPTRVAAWLVAWLAGQLGWKPQQKRCTGGNVDATFQGLSGPIRVSLKTSVNPRYDLARIESIVLSTRAVDGQTGERYELIRIDDSEHVRIDTCSENRCTLGRVVRAPEPEAARRIAAALESRRDDPPYHAALSHMLWLVAG